ncbi:MAG TPA: autotransporter domain-containing protein, partial [Bradyrhizobium sp.]|nr:autotransporter domain-containing protein [Bradyrhizobium sp.]
GATGTVTNAGIIMGTVGSGVYLKNGGIVTNQLGGKISSSSSGVYILGTGNSAVINAGTISGGSYSVQFKGSGTNVLALQTGSVLNGDVALSSGSSNALFLQSGSTTINGNLILGSNNNGTLVTVVSATGASRVNISGTAALSIGTVEVMSSGLFTHNGQQTFTIVSAAGGITGTSPNTFNPSVSIVNTTFLSNASVTENQAQTEIDLTVTEQASFAAVLPANASTNQVNVAKGIDNGLLGLGGGTLPPGFLALGNLPVGNLPGALGQISGEAATGSQQTTFGAMTQFMGLLLDPFVDGRGAGAGGGGATPFAAEASAYAADGKARANALFTKAPPASFEARWSVWAAGFGGSQTTDGNATLGSNTATSRIFGTAVGADYRFSPSTIAGFALAGGGTSFSVANSGTGRSDLFQAGAFVHHTIGPAYISGALAYGWQDVTTDRTVVVAGLDRLHAEFNANAFSGRVEGGYRFVSPWIGGVGITPYAAGQFTTFDLPAYAESALAGSNAFALSYNSKSVTDSRSELGFRTDKSYAMPNGVLTLRSRFAWEHDFNPDRNIAATFQSLPGASFVVGGAAQAPDSALTTASVEMKWLNGWSAAATFEGEFSNVTSSYAGKAVVRYNW